MSTITSSNFLKRASLSPYGDRYLLTAQGQFIELYDFDKFHSDDFNGREYVPIRTRVFERHNVYRVTVFKDTGHVLAITTSYNFNEGELFIRACLIHRDLFLEGGYADTKSVHELFKGKSQTTTFSMAHIPDSTEILLLTDTTLAHVRYSIEDDAEITVERIATFELQSLFPPRYSKLPIQPLCVGNSFNYEAIVSVKNIILFVKQQGDQWIRRMLLDKIDTQVVMMIPETEFAVFGGKSGIAFISTSSPFDDIRSSQLRILHQKESKTTTRALTYCARDGLTLVYELRDNDLSLWKIDNQSGSVSHERTFVHTPVFVDRTKLIGNGETTEYTQRVASLRRELKKLMPDILRYPVAALVVNNATGISQRELLITSCISGRLQILKTEDIMKDPVCSYIHLDQKNLSVDKLFPCWEFPLNLTTTLSRMTGLNNGVPVVINLENGTCIIKEITNPKVLYSNVKSKVTALGQTVAVFYNQRDLCFCIFEKDLRWKEDHLNCDIMECFICDVYICILTDAKILIFDIRVLTNEEEEEVQFVNSSIDFTSLNLEGATSDAEKAVGATLVFDSKKTHNEIHSIIFFKCKEVRGVALTKSMCSRETSLQEIYDRPFTGRILMETFCESPIIDVVIVNEHHFWQRGDGYLHKPDVRSGNNIRDYLPKDAKIEGFINIEGKDFNQSRTFVLARSKKFIYLKDVETLEDVTAEPIPFDFGSNPIFGHFDGPTELGRCILYTTSSPDCSGVTKLIRVEGRVNLARSRESVVHSGSFFQPDTVARLVHHKNSSGKQIITVVSTYGKTIELQELNGKGRVRFKGGIDISSETFSPIFIACFSSYYVHSSNTFYIIVGSRCRQLALVTWDLNTNKHHIGDIEQAESAHSLFFFGDEHQTDPPKLIVSVDQTGVGVIDVVTKSTIYKSNRNHFFNSGEISVHTACIGDDTKIHDIWMIYDKEAVLHQGRKSKFGKNPLTHSFSCWRGHVDSIHSISTRNIETSGKYADFVFVVKNIGQVGVLATLQAVGEIPTAIVYGEVLSVTDCISISLHAELLGCSVKRPNRLEATFRLFIATMKEIVSFVFTLSVDSKRVKVVEILQGESIATMIADPSHFVISNTEKENDGRKPRYGIVSGVEGTEVVRICPKKLQTQSKNK